MIEWKIKRDKFYGDIAKKLEVAGHSQSEIEKHLIDAGFFYDTSTEDVDIMNSLDILCTPLAFLQKPIQEKLAVVVISGSFCPIHDGHINSLKLSKEMIEKNGYQVLGSYISPSHDKYIFSKNKDKAIDIYKRIELINQFIKDEKEISVDPWEGVFNKTDINFTDVVVRLTAYLKKHLGVSVDVFFVCGGDNSNFSMSFQYQGFATVINRPGYEEKFFKYRNFIDNNAIDNNAENRILWLHDNDNDASSTSIRNSGVVHKREKVNLSIRIDNETGGLLELIYPYYKDIQINYANRQREKFKNMQMNLVSLDSVLRFENQLEISRHYDIFGARILKHDVRPGAMPLKEQAFKIPANNYFLIDDDISTGGTMKFAQKILELSGNKIEGYISLNKYESDEILDLRDFDLMSKNSGLVIVTPTGVLRAPYIYPYVCPYLRGSSSDPLQMSIDIWEFFEGIFDSEKLEEFLQWQKLFNYVGFSNEVTMKEICKWHKDKLTAFKS